MPFGMSNHSVDVLRPNIQIGQSGEINEQHATHISGLACRMQYRRMREEVYTGKESFMSDAVLYCNPDTDIEPDDRINDGGIEYEIKGMDPNHDNMNVYMKLELLKIG
jgi:hypothetical protein|tara:strand:- start:1241 stop:1564 length:324 start_codon:yes stop_codon:yes gene_type:complete